MMYAVLCYNDEQMVCGWSKEQDDQVMANLKVAHEKWEKSGKLKPSVRLLPTSAATTLHKAKDMVIDGPYAETKEALLGFYLIEVDSLDEALEFSRDLARANPGGAYEMRPIHIYNPGTPISGAYVAEREYGNSSLKPEAVK